MIPKPRAILGAQVILLWTLIAGSAIGQGAVTAVPTTPQEWDTYLEQYAPPAEAQPAAVVLIEPFTCPEHEYDTALDPKYLKEDHTNYQVSLRGAFTDYEGKVRSAIAAYQRIYRNDPDQLRILISQVNETLRVARHEFERGLTKDDIAFRAAIGNATERAEEAARLEQERVAEFQKNLERRRIELDNRKREYLKDKLAARGERGKGKGILEKLDDYTADATPALAPPVFAPEEFYAPRQPDAERRPPAAGAPITPTGRDRRIIRMLEPNASAPRPSSGDEPRRRAGAAPVDPLGNKTDERIIEQYDALLRDHCNSSDPAFFEQADSLLAEAATALARPEQEKTDR